MSVCNPDRLPVAINRRDAAPTPTGFAEIVGDDFPVLQGVGADWPYTLNLRVPSESMAKEIDFGSTHQAPGLSRLSDKSLSLCTSYRFFRQPIGFGHFENAIGYAKFYTRSHDAVIRVYDEADNVIETHEHKGDFKD